MEIQNTNLNIRIPKKLKERFIEVARLHNLTYSIVLRDMIARYVRDEGEGKQYDVITG